MAEAEEQNVSSAAETEDELSGKTFSHPTMAELEVQASKIVERLQSSQTKETEQAEDDGKKPVGGPLADAGKPEEEILRTLEELLMYGDNEESTSATALKHLDKPAQLAVVTHTIAAYVSTLEHNHIKNVATRITSDTSLWISRLFRFFEGSAFFHEDVREGLVRVTRLVMHSRYPKYNSDGYEVLYSRPPVIYISVAGRGGLGHYLCSQLGLPLSCVSGVPCNTVFGSQHKIDVAAFERLIQDDLAARKVPLLVVANAGTPVTGHVDNLQRLQELCKLYEVWLHVEGHSLAAQAMVAVPNSPARTGESMTLTLGQWLGVPGLPFITLYRSADAALIHAAGLSSFNLLFRLNCLPLWVCLQVLGQDGVHSRIRQAFELTQYLERKLMAYNHLKMLSPHHDPEGQSYTIEDLNTKPVSTTILFDIVNSTVVFHYVPEQNENDELSRNPPYFDNLNSWLGQILQRDAPQLSIEIVDIETSGYAIRFCPLETSSLDVTKQDVDDFISCLEQQLDILDATVKHKVTFLDMVGHMDQLQSVTVPQWAGLGGVRFVPSSWLRNPDDRHTDQSKQEANQLNTELVNQLRSIDSAFSIGEGDDGMICVRFGMVTAETDIEELLHLVLTTGQEIEESSRYLEKMTEIVKKGIEAVNEDLKRENEDRIWQEGILRHVPIVGSFVNWWSPPKKEVGIKGRSLNLQAGVVESTENIYKYHMQILQGSPNLNSTKLPPQPLIQTPVSPPSPLDSVGTLASSPQHSRSSSHSSQASHTGAVPVTNPSTGLVPVDEVEASS